MRGEIPYIVELYCLIIGNLLHLSKRYARFIVLDLMDLWPGQR